jgi:hypothetical protein
MHAIDVIPGREIMNLVLHLVRSAGITYVRPFDYESGS